MENQKEKQKKKIKTNNESGKIKEKQITEKETALYYSDLIIIQKFLKNFIEVKILEMYYYLVLVKQLIY